MRILKHITVILACIMLSTSGHAVQIRRGPGYTIPEYILPTDRDDPALWTDTPHLLTKGAAPGSYAISNIPRTGTVEYPLVLVDFTDLSFIISDLDSLVRRYEQIFNQEGYTDTAKYERQGVTYYGANGSVSDYFRAQSYGQYVPKFRIIGPIHMPKSYSYYGAGKDRNAEQMVKEIFDSIGASILSGYARNGNIDQLSIIYAGHGENYAGADASTIWPHARTISNFNRFGINNLKYACSCELFWDTDSILDGIGTFCHEFSHTLGLPDFYTSASQSDPMADAAMGFWSIMDYGNYEDGGFSPVGYTAFEKYSLGWMDLEDITYAGTYTLSDISVKPDPDNDIHCAYRLNTLSDDQFIILESHSKTGWYKYHESQGLMVTAVNYYSNDWNQTPSRVNTNSRLKRYYILPADNKYSKYTNDGDLFPYGNVDSITTLGTPVLAVKDVSNNRDTLLYPMYSIYNIRREAGKVTFLAGADMPSNVESPKQQETTVTVYDISGKPVLKTTTTDPEHISLPGHGIFIVKYGNVTRKISR